MHESQRLVIITVYAVHGGDGDHYVEHSRISQLLVVIIAAGVC